MMPSAFAQSVKSPKLLPISIIVSPHGAHVYIDDEFRGLGEKYNVTAGEHKLTIRARGYKTTESSLRVSEDNTEFRFSLTQLPAATIAVITEPEDAILYINGIYTGHTNKTFMDAPGEYQIHVEKQGYRSVDTTVTALSGAKNVIVCKLTTLAWSSVSAEKAPDKEQIEQLPAVKLKEVLFTVTPPDAAVYIDNSQVTSGASLLAEGRHILTASKEGYVLYVDTLNITSQINIKKDIVLEKRKSLFGFDVVPGDAEIIIDKTNYTGGNFARLTSGRHDLRISRKGYFSHSEVVEIVEGVELAKSYELKKSGGSISFHIQPDEASVRITGEGIEPIVLSGSDDIPFLVPGAYNISCTAVDYKQFDTTLTVLEGSSSGVDITLKPLKPMPYKTKDWLYSCIFPGAGQWAQGRPTIGYSAFAVGAAAIAYCIHSVKKYNSAVDNFNSANDLYRINPKDNLKKSVYDSKSQVDSFRKKYNVALAIWSVVYLSNIVEAYINRPVLYDYNIAISPVLQNTGRDVTCGMEIRMRF